MQRVMPLTLLIVASCVSSTSDRSAPDRVEGVAMTEEEAAEQVGVSVEALTDCGKACVAYSIAGCPNISNQCSNGSQIAFAGAYVTDCVTAKQLACGSTADLEYCIKNCSLR
jgi:hypothetical protein